VRAGERKPVHLEKNAALESNLTKISPEKTCLLPNIEAEEISMNIIFIYLPWKKKQFFAIFID